MVRFKPVINFFPVTQDFCYQNSSYRSANFKKFCVSLRKENKYFIGELKSTFLKSILLEILSSLQISLLNHMTVLFANSFAARFRHEQISTQMILIYLNTKLVKNVKHSWNFPILFLHYCIPT